MSHLNISFGIQERPGICASGCWNVYDTPSIRVSGQQILLNQSGWHYLSPGKRRPSSSFSPYPDTKRKQPGRVNAAVSFSHATRLFYHPIRDGMCPSNPLANIKRPRPCQPSMGQVSLNIFPLYGRDFHFLYAKTIKNLGKRHAMLAIFIHKIPPSILMLQPAVSRTRKDWIETRFQGKAPATHSF